MIQLGGRLLWKRKLFEFYSVRGLNAQVHYRGTLQDGTQFDASYDRGQPLDMVLGQGMVIQCWEKGIEVSVHEDENQVRSIYL